MMNRRARHSRTFATETGPLAPVILLASLTIAGCGVAALSPADEAAVRRASETYVNTWLAGDIDGWGRTIAQDAVYLVPNMPALEGHAAILEWARASTVTKIELTIHEIAGRGEVAFARGAYAVTATVPGGQPIEDRGKYLEVWQRQSDGAWRIIRDTWNSDLPAAVAVLPSAAPGDPSHPDAPTADPSHYTVEFENDVARLVRIRFRPGERSVMHAHPAQCVVFLTNSSARSTTPDGTSETFSDRAGHVACGDANVHLPENTGRTAVELVLVEFKNRRTFK